MSSAMADEELKLRFGKSSYQKAVMLSMVWNKGILRSQSIEFAAARPVSSSPRKSKSSEANLSSAPLLAFVDREYPPRARKTLFRVPPGPLDDSYRSSPVLNLIQLRLKGLVPADTDQYAYLVVVLIPMAQQQLYGNDGRRRFKLSPPANEALSSDLNFLEGFANPARTLHRKPGGASSMRIDYTRVPIWPFYGLKERLASALGSEVTGERFDGPDYDFYGEELSSNEAGLIGADEASSNADDENGPAATTEAKEDVVEPLKHFKEVHHFVKSTDTIVLSRLGDLNILSYAIVKLKFLLAMADLKGPGGGEPITPAMSHLEASFPWHLLYSCLNSFSAGFKTPGKYETCEFPRTAERRPFPEDWAMRGFVWAQMALPDDYFTVNESMEEDKRTFETSSMGE
uniref:Uncharacterized protein n=1 Tax=Pyricularia oryzae (strain P131) TaxID=1143193 RepID=L7IZQ9_PYRO1